VAGYLSRGHVGLQLFCFVGPLFYHTGQVHVNPAQATLSPGTDGHPLGTDASGYDVLGRLMVAGQISLEVGIAAALLATLVGVLWGAIAGYFGGALDTVMMRIVDAMLAIPTLFLALVVVAIVSPNEAILILVIALTSWLTTSRHGERHVPGRRHQLLDRSRPDLRDGRGVGMRQDHGRAAHRRPGAGDQWRHRAQRGGTDQAVRPGAPPPRCQGPAHVPGFLRVDGPAHAGGAGLREPLAIQRLGSRKEQQAKISDILDEVGLPRPAVERYPHEFSGGQRLGLARALILRPGLIVGSCARWSCARWRSRRSACSPRKGTGPRVTSRYTSPKMGLKRLPPASGELGVVSSCDGEACGRK
jgi:hypothetical protein